MSPGATHVSRPSNRKVFETFAVQTFLLSHLLSHYFVTSPRLFFRFLGENVPFLLPFVVGHQTSPTKFLRCETNRSRRRRRIIVLTIV